MRCLAPAGGFPSPLSVFKSILDPELVATFGQQLITLFQNQPISLCSSGKQAIEIISQYLSAKGYKKLILGAYSCPDVVAAALRGGLKVGLVDVNPRTLEPIFSNHNPNEEVLLLSNLYGLVDSISGLSQYKLIDDACQAAFSFDNELRIGSRGLGVLSFGRGKAICGIGGGAIVGFGETPEIFSEMLISLSRLFIYSILEHPSLYFIPASLPFFKLGATYFEPDYKNELLSSGKIATAYTALKGLDEEVATRRANQELWVQALDSKKVTMPLVERNRSSAVILTRFPILVPKNRDRIFTELYKAGLGASLSYPSSLDSLCSGHVEGSGSLPGAKEVALQIITLPTHRYVSKSDIEKASEIIEKYA